MSNEERTGLEIAVIGMSGRFPGARNITEFWENLKNGVESITFLSDDDLIANGVGPFEMNHPNYVRAAALLEDIEYFDADFFGFNPKEAEIMDPQQRIFLETAWEALENAGYDSLTYQDPVGVYAGVSMNTYFYNFGLGVDLSDLANLYQIMLANEKDYLSSRVSYKLNLTGPSVVVQSACSTSLVAVHLACRALLSGECNMALAGGVTVAIPQKRGYFYQEGGIFSPDGHCRAFDAGAKGTIGSNGAGVVVLKRLEDALEDRDYIHAIIRGTAINNDGSLKVGYSAPSVSGQAKVIEAAQIMAEVDPETISYIEAHGTGTPMGDPIEIAALKQVFQASTDKKGFCAVGSVKTNIGHLDITSGVTGLIKTVLSLEHELIPPTLHFKQPNPAIDFANSPFFVCDSLRDWKRMTTPRRAGVSSFGIGGTNAHAVLEEAPLMETSTASRPYQLLLLSAKTDSALETATSNLVDYLRRHNGLDLPDVAYTLQVGRRAFEHRRMVVCQNLDDAITALEERNPKRVFAQHTGTSAPSVAFMFSGQGAQYTNMGLDLYKSEPVFKEHIDNCSQLLKPHLGLDLRDVLYPSDDLGEDSIEQLDQTSITQPALFALEYSLARLWMKWGLQPRAMIGHSIGEYVAACLAGVFSLEDALALVALRGRFMQGMPAGAMLAVHLCEDEALQFLNEDLCVAAVNGPSGCTISGPIPAIEELEQRLKKSGVELHRLRTSHAFHSRMMEPAVAQLLEAVSKVTLNAPTIPFISNVSGTWITEKEAVDAGYWANHLRAAVRFGEGIAELLKEPRRLLLEVGPGTTLCSLIKQNHKLLDGQQSLASLRNPKSQQSDSSALLNALGKLWLAGAQVAWPGFYHNEQRQRLPLPTYPFERRRYCVEAPKQARSAKSHLNAPNKKLDVPEWFYIPSWKQSLPPSRTVSDDSTKGASILFFDDGSELPLQLAAQLELEGRQIIHVRAGERFEKFGDFHYTINARTSSDYKELLKAVCANGDMPNLIAHLWNVGPDDPEADVEEAFKQAQFAGFYSLVFLAQAIGELGITDEIHINVVINNTLEVSGKESLRPEKSAVLGPCKVIPQEYPSIICRAIDIDLFAPRTKKEKKIIQLLASELLGEASEAVVAYRSNYRWVQTYEPVRIEDQTAPKLLRHQGVYLITGGLGNIGLVLCEYLARTAQARLVLVGRSALPERGSWERWLVTHDEQDKVSLRIRKLLMLEELGAEVMAVTADTSDASEMRSVVEQALERFGAIHGVIHSAGLVDREALTQIQGIDYAQCEAHFRPKVYGLCALEKALRGAEVDFYLLMSSISSVLGGLGLVAYSAANIFMNAFARSRNQSDSAHWMSLSWDAWQFEDTQEQNIGIGAALIEAAITPQTGARAFQHVLCADATSELIISTGNLQARVDQWIELESVRDKQGDQVVAHARPDLLSNYAAPTNETERTIASIWEELLGVKNVGIHDNFFELGGDSILGIRVNARLNHAGIQLTPKDLFNNQTIAELAAVINEREPAGQESNEGLMSASSGLSQKEIEEINALIEGDVEDVYRLSPTQEGMLFHTLYAPGSGVYIVQSLWTMRGELNVEAFERAWNEIASHHSALRTSFLWKRLDKPVQIVHKSQPQKIKLQDWRGLSYAEQQVRLDAYLISSRKLGFDLSDAPSLDLTLIRLTEDRYQLIWQHHHILLDGWSMPLILKELISLYAAYSLGEEISLAPVRPYRDYVNWLHEQDPSKAEIYWRQALKGFTAPVYLARQQEADEKPDGKDIFGIRQVALAAPTIDALYHMVYQHQLTLNTILQGAWALLLSYYSGRQDVAFGVITSGRAAHLRGIDSMVGLFMNTLPVRVQVCADDKLTTWLKKIKSNQAEMLQYEHCSLVQVQAWSEVPNRQPLFDSLLTFQNYPVDSSNSKVSGHLEILDFRNYNWNNFPLSVVADIGDSLVILIKYDARQFDEAAIERLSFNFETLLSAVTELSDDSVSDLVEVLARTDKERDESKKEETKRTIQERFKNIKRRAVDDPLLIKSDV